MPKRFTDTEVWSKKWFRLAAWEIKLLWFYLKDKCDHAGIWSVDEGTAEHFIGKKIDWQKAAEYLKEQIYIFDNGEKWLVIEFIDFQYGVLDNRNVCKSVKSLLEHYKLDIEKIKEMKRNLINQQIDDNHENFVNELNELSSLAQPYPKACPSLKGKYKDKDIDKDKDKDNGKSRFRENVYLSRREFDTLLTELGADFLDRCIEVLDSYISNSKKGKEYTDHYKVMRSWVIKRVEEDGYKKSPCDPSTLKIDNVVDIKSKRNVDRAVTEALQEADRRRKELESESNMFVDMASLTSNIGRSIGG